MAIMIVGGRCSSTKINFSFQIKDGINNEVAGCFASTAPQRTKKLTGSIILSTKYKKCPHCDNEYVVVCPACQTLICSKGKVGTYTCPSCNIQFSLQKPIIKGENISNVAVVGSAKASADDAKKPTSTPTKPSPVKTDFFSDESVASSVSDSSSHKSTTSTSSTKIRPDFLIADKVEDLSAFSPTPDYGMGNYYYEVLSQKDKLAYMRLIEGVRCYEDCIRIAMPNSIDDVLRALKLCNPDLFYFGNSTISYATSCFGNDCIVKIMYDYNKYDAKCLIPSLQRELNSYKRQANDYLTEIYVVDRLATEVKYNHKDLMGRESHNLVGALLDKTTVCEGFAEAFAVIMRHLEIPCVVVTGTEVGGHNIGHAWNVVQLNGKNYHVDVTASSCSPTQPLTHFLINVTDAEMSQFYTFDAKYNCVATQYNYVAQNSGIITNFDDFETHLQNMKEGDVKEFRFDCNTADLIKKVSKSVHHISQKLGMGFSVLSTKNYYRIECK